jgi:hypothetical protein
VVYLEIVKENQKILTSSNWHFTEHIKLALTKPYIFSFAILV